MTRANREASSCFGLILAAGRGTRFGGRKQFALVHGRPLIYYALRAFECCPQVRETVVVTIPEMIDRVERHIRRWRMRKVKWIVAGGTRRQDSVRRGLRALPDKGLVAIHDGVRPVLEPRQLSRGFARCRQLRAVIYARPIHETVKETRGSRLTTLDRSGLWAAQTPQFFELGLIKRAASRAAQEGYQASDDAALVERLGRKVGVLEGWPENIKVTTRADLRLVSRLLTVRGGR